jgi:hypothetical protein
MSEVAHCGGQLEAMMSPQEIGRELLDAEVDNAKAQTAAEHAAVAHKKAYDRYVRAQAAACALVTWTGTRMRTIAFDEYVLVVKASPPHGQRECDVVELERERKA